MNRIEIKFKRLEPDALLPRFWTDGSVGLDIHAYCMSSDRRPITHQVPANSTRVFKTGLAIEPPEGYVLFVCSRAGLAANAVFVTNAPGIIDPDYRGELRVLLHNAGFESQFVKHGDRIAQLIGFPATLLAAVEVLELSRTERGDRGFGSTGL